MDDELKAILKQLTAKIDEIQVGHGAQFAAVHARLDRIEAGQRRIKDLLTDNG